MLGSVLGFVFSLLLLLSAVSASNDGICPDPPAVTEPCTQVNDWNELKSTILGATGIVVLCPFDITTTDRYPLSLSEGVTVMCQQTLYSDECTIRGGGEHVHITSLTEVVFHGISFKESDEHAVYIESGIDTNVHTFCHCTFERNRRIDGQRGGAFKTEMSTGTVNFVSCTFRENYSASYGGAIYTRSNFTNIVDSLFIGNTASGPGGAIAAASYADLSIQNSVFDGNFGEDTFAIIVRPLPGPTAIIDGGENLSINNGDCNGFYDWSANTCTEFTSPPTTSAPTITRMPTVSPSSSPSVSPTNSPTISLAPTITMAPTISPSSSPSQAPTVSAAPSVAPTVSMEPTSIAKSRCGDLELFNDQACQSISSWDDLLSAVANASDVIIFCPFAIPNDVGAPVVLNRDIDIHCPSRSCVVYGNGTHLQVEGDNRNVISGVTFAGSQKTAVQIRTTSYSSVTTFCNCNFYDNKRYDDGGGAIRTREEAGEVNIVECELHRNAGTMGGAIFSRAFRTNIIGSHITDNTATVVGGSIYMGWHAHLLIRGSAFSRNRAETDNYSITIVPPEDETGIQGTFVDAGDNMVADDGLCGGFYDMANAACHEFLAVPALPTLIYPYIPGQLSTYDSKTGLLLSSGLSVRQLAKTGEPVVFESEQVHQQTSSVPFHKEPDGAAVVATSDGGYIYISNSEQSVEPINGTGGVYALVFDSKGEIRDYQVLLTNTTRNCNGGLTPWNTWISCEEVAGGQCWQVHPLGLREPQITSIGEAEGGSFEAFTYDIRNASQPCFFVTEDHERGALRRWCPDSHLVNETWDMLHGSGTRHYLKFLNDSKFEWTPSLEEGRQSAQLYFPFTEGISHDGNGTLYFVSKELRTLFICNLDTFEYRAEFTNNSEVMKGEGKFSGTPDHVVQGHSNDVLYFTEESGRPGVYGRKKSTGEYFSIVEGQHDMYEHDEAVGLAWSPDWTRLYFCIQDKGVLFEIRRDDGLPFEYDPNQLRLNYHVKKES